LNRHPSAHYAWGTYIQGKESPDKMAITPNALFHADCIEMIQRVEAESVDLVYLDPPLLPQRENRQGPSTRERDNSSYQQLQFISRVCQQAQRVLRPTGVVFFHAQPLSAFSVRLILNQVFGEENFRNEFVWQYQRAPLSRVSRSGTQHDAILYYGKSRKSTDNAVFRALSRAEERALVTKSDPRGRFVIYDLTAKVLQPDLRFEWRGVVPPKGRSWRFRLETLQQLDQDGRIYWGGKKVMPRLKVFLNERAGIDVGTIWTDIPHLSPASKENLRYPSQKPLGVIERLIHKGSNEGEVVLDPFCGSGTTIVAAERHKRRWIACDTSGEAIEITMKRIKQEFGKIQPADFSMGDAQCLNHIAVKRAEFKRVAVRIDDLVSIGQLEFILNHEVPIEETRHFEFKEIRSSAGAVDNIVNASDEYAVAFLNSEGGRIYWGIRDKDRIVVGVRLSYQERDKVRRDVSAKLNQIEPRVDPSRYRVEIHEVHDEHGQNVPDMCVVEMVVPASDSSEPYYTSGGDAWVKVDGIKQKLKGIALTDFMKHRLTKSK
jgi:DNA modification methylase